MSAETKGDGHATIEMTVSARDSVSAPLIGLACHWQPSRAATWSGTSLNLERALSQRLQVVDLPAEPPAMVRSALRAVHLRRSDVGWRSHWQQSAAIDRWHHWHLSRQISQKHCDVVIQVQDLAALDVPYFIYQDLSYDAVLRHMENPGVREQFSQLSPELLERRRERQAILYAQAHGIIAMSQWFADSLVRDSGVPREKVTVVHPGASAVSTGTGTTAVRDHGTPRRRVLFVGKAFHRKGGDTVVAAFNRLRHDHDPNLVLTIAGPAAWPLPTPIPEGVRFVGSVPTMRIAELLDSHDLLVLPSRFEAFGIAVAEALSRGVPCVVRNAFAMPEMVTDGVNGRTVDSLEAESLAAAMLDVLSSDDIHRHCQEQAPRLRDYYSWARAAEEIATATGAITATEGRRWG